MKMGLFFLLLGISASAWAEEPTYFSYDDLIRQIEADKVQSVTLDHFSSIEGTWTDGSGTKNFTSYADLGSANDPLLNRLLQAHNVKVAISDSNPGPGFPFSWITSLIMFGIPLGILLLLVNINTKLNELLAVQRNIRLYSEPKTSKGSSSAESATPVLSAPNPDKTAGN